MYTKDMSTGIGMVYSAPAAPIKVAFTVGVEPMGTWVPDNAAQAYAARSVLQSVMAAMGDGSCLGLLRPGAKKAGERISSEWKKEQPARLLVGRVPWRRAGGATDERMARFTLQPVAMPTTRGAYRRGTGLSVYQYRATVHSAVSGRP